MADYATIKLFLDAVQAAATPYGGGRSIGFDVDQRLAAGTSANMFDLVHRSTRDPGATTAEDVDLRLLTDAEGAVMSSLAEIVLLAVQAPSTNTANYEIKPSVANGLTCFLKDASDIIVVPPGEFKILVCNFADGKNVVDNTHKSLNINNLGDANSELYLYLLGRSA